MLSFAGCLQQKQYFALIKSKVRLAVDHHVWSKAWPQLTDNKTANKQRCMNMKN